MNPSKRIAVAGLAVLCLATALSITYPLTARASYTAVPVCRGSAVAALGGPLTALPCVVSLAAPNIRQDMPLDCESAALAVALRTKGFPVTQDWVFNQLPKDTRAAVLSGGYPVRWGDPYLAFVGNVYGSETDFTGYGVYYGPIAAAARRAGASAQGRTGWTTEQIEDQVRSGNPVVVWTNYDFGYSATRHWRAWDGAWVPYTTREHAVTVVGVNLLAGTVTVVDVWQGSRRTLSEPAFTQAIATFGGMAVAVS